MAVVTARTASGTRQILRGLQLDRYFEAVVGIEDVERSKPDPEPVRLALDYLEVAPSRAVMVGDTVHDMEAGRRAGTRTIGVATGPHPEEELLASGAEHVVAHLGLAVPLLFE